MKRYTPNWEPKPTEMEGHFTVAKQETEDDPPEETSEDIPAAHSGEVVTPLPSNDNIIKTRRGRHVRPPEKLNL